MSEPSGPAIPSARVPLPDPPRPRGSYVPWARHENLVVTAGMTPRDAHGELIARGLVGGDVDLEVARRAAAQAARNALAAVVGAAGGLDKVEQCLRMSVFIACVDGFTDLSALADAASEELESHLGPGRRPARSAIGVRSLPGGAPIEIELTAIVGS